MPPLKRSPFSNFPFDSRAWDFAKGEQILHTLALSSLKGSGLPNQICNGVPNALICQWSNSSLENSAQLWDFLSNFSNLFEKSSIPLRKLFCVPIRKVGQVTPGLGLSEKSAYSNLKSGFMRVRIRSCTCKVHCPFFLFLLKLSALN